MKPLLVLAALSSVFLAACSLELEDTPRVIHARFDPDEDAIPMPNDLLRDDDAGHLDIPVDDEDLTDAEIELYTNLNRLDGWPSTYQAKVEFSGSISEDTVDPDTVQIWEWSPEPVRVTEVTGATARAGQELLIDPPENGWKPGHEYVIFVRGGEDGVLGRLGEKVVADTAFYFLRLQEKLDTPAQAHQRAFPGDTREERLETARDLEEVRVELVEYFDFFDSVGIPREDIAVLWNFTVSEHAELAMDEATERMPLPFDLLLDPMTGKVDLAYSEDDTDLVRTAKRNVNGLDGFALSGTLMFEFSRALDPATVTPEQVELYELGGSPDPLPVDARLLPDGIHVVVEPQDLPLKEQTTYSLVVYDGLLDRAGLRVVPMPAGYFLKSESPIAVGQISQIGTLSDVDAVRIEGVREKVAPLLDRIGREGVVTAWPFTTQTVLPLLLDAIDAAEDLQVPVDPDNLVHMSPLDALLDFLIGIESIINVKEVVHGTIKSPVYLDRVTRGFREDGDYELEDIAFTMTIPDNVPPEHPLPVVIFGHGLMTERRFVLALGDWLGEKGFAVIAIDLPYHGTRTHCIHGGPMSVPHPLTGELIGLEPCADGTTCAADGRCVDAQGNGNALSQWPIIGYPMASGAAFLEIEEITNSRDHFVQAMIDLQALKRSLKEGDWEPAIGYRLVTDRMYYVGQSLGGILGGIFVPINDDIERAVLNVPGADVVDMFNDSVFFGPQVDAFFVREDITRGSYEAERFFNVARWIMDAADPHSVAHMLQGRNGFIQMALLDIIITNPYTEKLQAISGLPMKDYPAEHAFLVIPLEQIAGATDMRNFIAGEFNP
jgi:hypothetical protein